VHDACPGPRGAPASSRACAPHRDRGSGNASVVVNHNIQPQAGRASSDDPCGPALGAPQTPPAGEESRREGWADETRQRWRPRFTEETDIWHKKVAEFSWCTLISTPSTRRNSTSGITREHLPELLSVPVLSAARYEAVKGGPQYLACYELESVAVLQTPAFTNRPRTPWGQKVSPSVIGKNLTRIVGEQIYPDGIEMPERGMAPVLPQGAGSDLRSSLSGPRGYQRLQHGLRICQYGRTRKPGVEGTTATFVAQFAAHAAGHDACTGFCRGVRTGESLSPGFARCPFCKSCELSWSRVRISPERYGSPDGAKRTRAVKFHIACSASSRVALKPCCGPRGRKRF
jgi:hypothetical protein